MPVKVMIPTPLRQYTGNQELVTLNAGTVGQVLEQLVSKYANLKRHLYDENGKLRNFVNVYVNEEDVRYLKEMETCISDGDTLTIVPAIAGGVLELERKLPPLSNEEIKRYGRHLIMPEVGMDGQQKIKAAKVLLVGTGGLGSPTGLYLAAAGVGRIGLVDFDVVDDSNLQRQIIFASRDVGRPKLEAAKDRLLGINPHIQVDSHETKLASENALSIIENYDVIVDGTDNFPTRYLINDACVLLGKPNVYGSIFRFEGQASVFDARKGPCYRCLYPEPPPPGLVPSCAEGGVLGILPGVVGVIQATETLKLILGKGQTLVGRLLLFDALKMRFSELKLRKDPKCNICGPNPTIRQLIDYEEFCGIRGGPSPQVEEEFEITPVQLEGRMKAGEPVTIIDVREPHEYQICNIPSSKLIPVNEVPNRVNELSTAEDIVVHCHTGGRSSWAVSFLRQLGFRRIKNLTGGIDAWAEQIDPSMPRY